MTPGVPLARARPGLDRGLVRLAAGPPTRAGSQAGRATIDAMPSWNIHTAHVERLLAEDAPSALGIRDVNAFLFGNLVPDIYVGYMVPDTSRTIAYQETHFADPGYVPVPRYEEFFERFVAPGTPAGGLVPDVVLGAWAHLVADHVYNERFNQLIDRIGVSPGTVTRERKQADFDTYGRMLEIHLVPEPTEALLAQAARFPQYAIGEADVRAACRVMAGIVRDDTERPVHDPSYRLLGDEYFSRVPDEADDAMRRGLRAYAAGDAAWGGRP